MRAKPMSAAPPYITGPMAHAASGHQRLVCAVTAAAAAKPATECPDGNDRYFVSARNPRKSCQLSGLGTESTYGRARPKTYFMLTPSPSPIKSASVPYKPSRARRSLLLRRPTAYIDVPMMTAPGTAIVLKPIAAFLRYHFPCGAGD